jgi:glycosyltransferase involved in cell wall biosynthesis
MTPIKLLAIVEARSVTGPARNLIEFVLLAQSAGIETIVATFLRKENTNLFTEKLEDLSIPVFRLSEESAYDLSTIQKLKRLLSQLKPDLIQTHAVKSHFLTRLSGVHHSVPWIAFHHGYTSTSWRNYFYNELDRWSLKAASQVVTVSHASLEQLRSKGIHSEKIRVIHNAVHAGYSTEPVDTPSVAALRASLGIPVGQKVILSVGRLSKEKDQASLVDAMTELRGSFSPYLLIVGEGPEQKTIVERARTLRLTNKVILMGQQDHIRPFYALADVVVISSRSEGSPNVLLEALAAGVPVVATAVGGIPEMVEDGKHALLVRHGNTRQMATSIARIFTEPDVAQNLVRNGKILVRTKFSPEERARTLSELYEKILESRRKACL